MTGPPTDDSTSPRRGRGEQSLRSRWEQHLRGDPGVTGSLLCVLLVAATYANPDGTRMRATEETLAAATGLSARSVRRYLDDARKRGLLLRTRKGHRLGSGIPMASEHELRMPPLPATRDLLTCTSTGHARPLEAVSTGQRDDLNRSPVAPLPVTGDRLPGSDHEETTSLSPAVEEVPAVYDAEERREEEPAEETFGSRALAALGRTDLRPGEVDALLRTAERRLGLTNAADAVCALLAMPNVRNLAAYAKGIDDADWHELAERHRDKREQRAQVARIVPTPHACDHGHPNGLRRAADGSSPCARCDLAVVSA